MVKNQGRRAALYIDGFNLYHSILDLNMPHLKWINLWQLGEIFCGPLGQRLVKVVICTAVPDDGSDTQARHQTFNQAQRACGVTILKGHHIIDQDSGKRTEKQSDINLAAALLLDAEDDLFDDAFILTADSDQAATGYHFKMRQKNADRRLFCAAPPGRSPPQKLSPYTFGDFAVRIEHLEQCVMPQYVQGKTGPIRRPDAYTPPPGWVHPADRPKKIKTQPRK